jgi:hypothetical protein
MNDLELENADLRIVNGDLVLVEGAEQVAQALEIRLNSLKGEWFLDRTYGVPYFDEVLGKPSVKASSGDTSDDVASLDAVIRQEILGVAGVNKILSYRSSIDRANRVYSVTFAADTIYGPIQYEGELP